MVSVETVLVRSRAVSPSLPFVVVTVMIGVMMGVMDAAIAYVAIPAISGNLGATVDEAVWVTTGYTLGMMIVMPLNGWLTNRLGQKWYYISAFGVFTVMSFMCGTATGIWPLIVFRALQGAGGGALQPIALSILLRAAPPDRRGDMIGAFSFASLAPFALGPVIGGYILDNYDWRWLFFFKLPVCVLGLVLAYVVLTGDDAPAERRPLQWTGLVTIAIALTSLQIVLSRGQQEDWFDSERIVLLTAVAIAAFVVFVWSQVSSLNPFVDVRIFRTVSFAVGCFITVISGFGLYGINLVTPLFFQGPLHLSAYDTGIFLLQGTIACAAVIPFVGPLTRRIDARIIIGVGLAMFGIGAWMMGDLTADAGFWDIFWPRILQGLALGLLFVPLVAATLAQIPARSISDATGISTVVRYLGGNIAIAVLQFLQVRRSVAVAAALAASATFGNPAIGALVHTIGIDRARLLLFATSTANANLIAYLFVFRLSAIVFISIIPLLLFLPDPRTVRHAPTAKRVEA